MNSARYSSSLGGPLNSPMSAPEKKVLPSHSSTTACDAGHRLRSAPARPQSGAHVGGDGVDGRIVSDDERKLAVALDADDGRGHASYAASLGVAGPRLPFGLAPRLIWKDRGAGIYDISTMDIADVDLNLLVVFDALLRTRSVTGAARTLGMSQPATSFALNRLRKMFGDPLFVRTSRGIHPTPYAEGTGGAARSRSSTGSAPTCCSSRRSIRRLSSDRSPSTCRTSASWCSCRAILDRLAQIAPGVHVRTRQSAGGAARTRAAHRRSRPRARLLSGADRRGAVSAAAVHAFLRLHRARRPSHDRRRDDAQASSSKAGTRSCIRPAQYERLAGSRAAERRA